MKKTLLLLLVLASVANAAPRFGLLAEQGSGLGAIVSDDIYSAYVTYTSASTTDGFSEAFGGSDDDYQASKITLGGNYKIALDSVTALTAGVSYALISGDAALTKTLSSGSEIDTGSEIALNVGLERALSSNIILTTQASVYTTRTISYESGGDDSESSTIFSNGRVGIAYLF